jgi:hypothetical protein
MDHDTVRGGRVKMAAIYKIYSLYEYNKLRNFPLNFQRALYWYFRIHAETTKCHVKFSIMYPISLQDE